MPEALFSKAGIALGEQSTLPIPEQHSFKNNMKFSEN
ncbi:hypothetical protein G5S_0997 [Chlamydia pecorum E58]|uniref:Uncharacterized protein n=1 Tax=Chlamydia pecorum (strain ATCC VR-628 / DSM 29919 / E58) TaxID=331635 RepID=A0AA34RDW9_CHLPE|nr:hypothetical protein G5S_0997 [Chlamydia pecorum E58]